MRRNNKHVRKDLIIVMLSIIVAVSISRSGLINQFLFAEERFKFLESFFAGIFFTSAFTTAPAIAFLSEISRTTSPLTVAFFGALGALTGDAIIFRFIRNRLLDDFLFITGKAKRERIAHIFHSRLLRWFTPFIAALILASPLPDELGIMLMGFSKTSPSVFVIFSFIANFAGIFAIAYLAKNIF